MNIILTSRIVTGWVIVCCVILVCIINKNDPFYRFGPNENLKFIGITIDTGERYACIVTYCFLNTIIRQTVHNILQPWILLNIQDSTNKTHVKNAHEIVTLNTVYNWFDWFVYINLLLAQIDMIIVESVSEIIVTNVITFKYIRDKEAEVSYEQL